MRGENKICFFASYASILISFLFSRYLSSTVNVASNSSVSIKFQSNLRLKFWMLKVLLRAYIFMLQMKCSHIKQLSYQFVFEKWNCIVLVICVSVLSCPNTSPLSPCVQSYYWPKTYNFKNNIFYIKANLFSNFWHNLKLV